jgi:dual specificity tyrosine-phosphorylation-regulated kinase 2/3/4
MHEIRPIARDIFAGLACLHQRSIVHCDVKPENILFRHGQKNRVKLIDFGTSAPPGDSPFEYFQSRFYRAPEAILEMPIGPELDIWSTGCVLAEMAIGDPLFAGQDDGEQLALFVELLGPPPPSLHGKISADLRGRKKRKRRQLKRRIDDPKLVSLIGMCLMWNPTERISANDALRHPFLSS